MIVLESILPVFGLIFLGVVLKRVHLTTDAYLATSDRLVYFVFFPLMLFWKIGGAGKPALNGPLVAAGLCALACTYGFGWIGIRIFRIGDYQAGTFSQSCYRFNTYIGMAVIITALGEEAVGSFGVLIGVMIPVINLLAVATLIWYSGKAVAARDRNRLLIKTLISNPLIIGCLAGMGYGRIFTGFPVFVDNALRLASLVTLPLALLSIGGNLTFANFKAYAKPAGLAALIKLLALPLAGYFFLRLFDVTGQPLRVGMLYFALPTSPVIFILSSQLNSDIRLASAAIVVSTLLGLVSLTLVLAIFF
ncbi:MAG: AEC family transporter [Desulfobacterales bacterium]